jgi:hypothetical protein
MRGLDAQQAEARMSAYSVNENARFGETRLHCSANALSHSVRRQRLCRESSTPPAGHTVGWVAVGKGALTGSERLSNGELVIFEPGEAAITVEGAEGTGATFVLGSAVPHPYELHLGAYSVHTSADALAAGEGNLRELKKRLDARGDRRTASGSTPVFRG